MKWVGVTAFLIAGWICYRIDHNLNKTEPVQNEILYSSVTKHLESETRTDRQVANAMNDQDIPNVIQKLVFAALASQPFDPQK